MRKVLNSNIVFVCFVFYFNQDIYIICKLLNVMGRYIMSYQSLHLDLAGENTRWGIGRN
jgi:hypothetical protein